MKDFIVIGAGVLGASTAYHLARAGASVTVIDRKDEGRATSAAAGIICPWLSQRRNKAWYSLAKGGAAYYPTLIKFLEEDGETDTGYKQVGAVSLHHDPLKLDKLVERAMKRRVDAPEIGEIVKLTPDETSKRFPLLAPDFGSVFVSGAARVNGRALQQALIKAAKKHHATFIDGSAELEILGNTITGVRVGDTIFKADGIIVTAGAWAAEILSPLGIQLQLSSQKGQIVHLQSKATQTGAWPVVIPPNDQYILAFEHGRIVIGATHENNQHFDMRITAGGLHEIFDKALATAPGLANVEFVEARVGYRPFTPNFLPVIGGIPNIGNLFIANGLGASGLTVGPFLGAQLANLVLREPLDIDLTLYDVAAAIKN